MLPNKDSRALCILIVPKGGRVSQCPRAGGDVVCRIVGQGSRAVKGIDGGQEPAQGVERKRRRRVSWIERIACFG